MIESHLRNGSRLWGAGVVVDTTCPWHPGGSQRFEIVEASTESRHCTPLGPHVILVVPGRPGSGSISS